MPFRRPKLERLDAKGDVSGLVDALAPRRKDFATDVDGDPIDVGWKRRREAATRLAAHQSETATKALHEALQDDAEAVRLAALTSLATARTGTQPEMVSAALSLGSEQARTEAARVLSSSDSESLLLAYVDADAEDDSAFPDAWVSDLRELLDTSQRRTVVQEATDRLLHDTTAARAWQVAMLDAHDAARAMAPRLSDEADRLTALAVLSRLRSAAVLDEVVALTRDEDLAVRRAAVTTLGEIRHPRGVEALLHASIDDDYDVRDAAMTALDRFGTAGSVWGMATMARGVIADAGGWPADALGSGDGAGRALEPPAAQPQLPPTAVPTRRRRWRRG